MARRPESRTPLPPGLPGGNGPFSDAAPLRRVLHWGAIMGGLVIIADLASRLTETPGSEEGDPLNLMISALLYFMAGTLTHRDTEKVALGALAGVLAGLLDGIVVGAAEVLAPRPIPEGVALADVFVSLLIINVVLGTVLATLGAWVGALLRRRSGP